MSRWTPGSSLAISTKSDSCNDAGCAGGRSVAHPIATAIAAATRTRTTNFREPPMTRSIREAGSIRPGAWAVLALLLAGSFAREARADGACSTVRVPTDNAVILWDDVALQAVRRAPPGPTVVSRALAVLHTSMFDAWTAYDATAVPTVMRRGWRRPAAERTADRKSQA